MAQAPAQSSALRRASPPGAASRRAASFLDATGPLGPSGGTTRAPRRWSSSISTTRTSRNSLTESNEEQSAARPGLKLLNKQFERGPQVSITPEDETCPTQAHLRLQGNLMPTPWCRRTTSPVHSARPPGFRRSRSKSTTPTELEGLLHGQRAELEQPGADHQRAMKPFTTICDWPLSATEKESRKENAAEAAEHDEGPRPLGSDRRRRGAADPTAIRHDGERVAHVPGDGRINATRSEYVPG